MYMGNNKTFISKIIPPQNVPHELKKSMPEVQNMERMFIK